MKFLKVLLHFLWPVNCPVCGRLSENICDSCINSLFWDHEILNEHKNLMIHAASFYHTEISKIILAFKYSNMKNLCRPIGRAMGKFLVRPDVDFLLPVPLHINSPRKYNQAYEIARGLKDCWGIKISRSAKWSREIPNRVGMNAQERTQLEKNAFIITSDIKDLRIALVDDVCTTGTTLLRLAEICRDSGAKVDCAYTLATVTGK